MQQQATLTTLQKALHINLLSQRYGTIAEIGAGQEVARFFFQAGGAAGTVAKTISAYDMKMSDSIYGESARYVSKERLRTMLEREYGILIKRLKSVRAPDTTFFSFANTVTAKSYNSKGECHGWVGINFQLIPGGEVNEILLHVRMHDTTNLQQQSALGILGINLIYGAFENWSHPMALIEGLLDGLSWDRIEIDFISFSGPQFIGVDNRLMMLHLVTVGHTEVAMFDANGNAIIPAEALYKKDLLVLRGTFSPPTKLHFDMENAAKEKFKEEEGRESADLVPLCEMNIRPFKSNGVLDGSELIARMEALTLMGYPVLITRFLRYFRLNDFFAHFGDGQTRYVLSVENTQKIFDDSYYEGSEGGTMLALGKLFSPNVKLYVYPNCHEDFSIENLSGIQIPYSLELLFEHLTRNNYIMPLEQVDPTIPVLESEEVLQKIAQKDISWCDAVPPKIVDLIKTKKYFGY